MTKQVKDILIAINQPLTEVGITALLSDDESYKIIGTVHSKKNLVENVVEKKPDLLIADYNVEGFISPDDIQSLMERPDHPNILIISSDDNKNSILKVVHSGIKGYLTHECGKNEFLLAVESTARGERFFCSKILDIILNPEKNSGEANNILTPREQEILRFLALGHSTQTIADTLHLSPHTVQTHRKSIIRKLTIKSPTQFVVCALEMGLIPGNQKTG